MVRLLPSLFSLLFPILFCIALIFTITKNVQIHESVCFDMVSFVILTTYIHFPFSASTYYIIYVIHKHVMTFGVHAKLA